MTFNKLVPELNVSNLEKSLDFYINILGFKLEYKRNEPEFALISREGAQLMLEENPNSPWNTGALDYPRGRGINLQITVSDVHLLVKALEKKSYPLKLPLKDSYYHVGDLMVGCREFLVMDPDGYLLRFSQELGHRPAGEE